MGRATRDARMGRARPGSVDPRKVRPRHRRVQEEEELEEDDEYDEDDDVEPADFEAGGSSDLEEDVEEESTVRPNGRRAARRPTV